MGSESDITKHTITRRQNEKRVRKKSRSKEIWSNKWEREKRIRVESAKWLGMYSVIHLSKEGTVSHIIVLRYVYIFGAYKIHRYHCVCEAGLAGILPLDTSENILLSINIIFGESIWGNRAMGQGAIVMWLKTIGHGRGGHSCKPNPYSLFWSWLSSIKV